MNKATMLELDDVSFRHQDSEKNVLYNISLSLAEKECVAVVGPSGVGKTTLLRLILGVLRPSRGAVTLKGPITLVGQREQPLPKLTPRQQIELVVRREERIWDRVFSSPEAAGQVNRFLKIVKLEDHADKDPAQLSGGQLQRLAFAQALAHGSKVLLLDEPFGALDFASRENMQRELMSLITASGLAVILVTHDIAEAVYSGDRILVLANSKGGARSVIFENIRPEAEFQNKYSAAFLKSCALIQSAFQTFEKDLKPISQILDQGTVQEIELMQIEAQAEHVFVVTREFFQEQSNPIIRASVEVFQKRGLSYSYFVPELNDELEVFRDITSSPNVKVTCLNNDRLEQWYLFGETVLYKMPNGAWYGYSYLGDIGATSLFRLPDQAVEALVATLELPM